MKIPFLRRYDASVSKEGGKGMRYRNGRKKGSKNKVKPYEKILPVRIFEKDYQRLIEEAKDCNLGLSDYVRLSLNCKLKGETICGNEEGAVWSPFSFKILAMFA